MARGRKRELSQRKRWEIINLKKISHLSNRAIARRVACSEGTVRHLLKKESLYGHVEDLPRPGRPPKLNKAQRTRFSSLIKKHRGATGKDLAVYAKQSLHVNLSTRTAQQVRRQLGYRRRTRKRRPKLTVADLGARLRWCRKRRNWVWASAVFLDIMTVRSSEARGHVWAKKAKKSKTSGSRDPRMDHRLLSWAQFHAEAPAASPPSKGG